jgi:hypothetical protein
MVAFFARFFDQGFIAYNYKTGQFIT